VPRPGLNGRAALAILTMSAADCAVSAHGSRHRTAPNTWTASRLRTLICRSARGLRFGKNVRSHRLAVLK
jgi:hypothetical protein